MKQAEMEEAIRNHDRRLMSVEQILPTLATKDDLDAVKRHTGVLIEDVRDDIRKVAEGVATLTMTLQQMAMHAERRFEAVDRRFDTVDAQFEAVDRRFDMVDERFEAVGRRFDTVDHRIDTLAEQIAQR